MRVLVLCGTFALGVVAWACYTAGPWSGQGRWSSPSASSGNWLDSAPENAPSGGESPWEKGSWQSAPPSSRPVLARGGRFVRRAAAAAESPAIQLKPVSSRRRKVQRPEGASRPQVPPAVESVSADAIIFPEEDQAELELAREFFAVAPKTGASSAEKTAPPPAPQEQKANPVPGSGSPLQVVGPGAAEVILSLTDRFRNSVLRGSVFDPTKNPRQVEELSRELVQTIKELQAQQAPSPEATAPPPAEAEAPAEVPVWPPAEAAEGKIAVAAPAPPGQLDPEHELVVRTLREAARHLEEAANDLEWTARYHLADLLRQTAAELRHRAREFQPPRD